VNHRAWWAVAAACVIPLLNACGGGGSSGGNGAVRLVNAADDQASLDLYAGDTSIASAVATGTAGAYASVGAGTYTMQLKPTGSNATASSASRTVGSDTSYTVVAYTSGEALKSVLLTDDEAAPTSGSAKLRVFNASIEAGALDVYVTTPDASLSASTPYVQGLGTERIGGYVEYGAGTWRIRVTGNGDKTDLRLDIPSITLTDQEIATLVVTSTPGGVLVHGLVIQQKSTVAAFRNGSARLRLVASAAGGAAVAATANGTSLSAGLTSPAIGNYTLVNAGALALDVSIGGTAVTAPAPTLAAGSDTTLLVTGSAAAPVITVLADDNRPALLSGNTKLRLVHGVSGLASPITLTADYAAVATDVAPNTASTPASMAASTTLRIEATSPAVAGSMFLATDVTLQAGRVYTLFMLGDTSASAGVLRRDR